MLAHASDFGQVFPEDAEEDAMIKKRHKMAKQLVDNLAKLFAQMFWANRKYVDPTQVLKSLVDDMG
jgi:ubiquitin carboxyl-terminal hydrolase 25/28